MLPEQVEKAQASIVKDGVSALDVLLQDGALSEHEILSVLAAQFGMEVVSLRDVDIPNDVRDAIPHEVVRKYRVVPVYRSEEVLTVALSDPLDVDNLDTLRYLLKCSVEPGVAPREEIQLALDKYYPLETDVEQVLDRVPDGAVDVSMRAGSLLPQEEQSSDADAPIT